MKTEQEIRALFERLKELVPYAERVHSRLGKQPRKWWDHKKRKAASICSDYGHQITMMSPLFFWVLEEPRPEPISGVDIPIEDLIDQFEANVKQLEKDLG